MNVPLSGATIINEQLLSLNAISENTQQQFIGFRRLFLCGWSVGLEFPAGQPAESDYWREHFQTISEDVSVCNVLVHSDFSALEVSRRCAI